MNPTSLTPTSEIFFQLEENFRMNPQLCNFVELIYQKRFLPMQSRREIANLGRSITERLTHSSVRNFLEGMAEVMQFGRSRLMIAPTSFIHEKIPIATTLFLMNLVPPVDTFQPSELHVAMEAKVAAQLVQELQKTFTEETIFVVTPHRIQRSLVTRELTSYGLSLKTASDESRIWVDTTERMQGNLVKFL
jgi:AAA domain